MTGKEEAVRVVAERLASDLLAHPLTKRFALKIQASGDNQVYSPADVLGERALRIADLLLTVTRTPEQIVMNLEGAAEKTAALVALASVALPAMPYLWTEEVRAALRASGDPSNLPRHTISPRLLPSNSMWWTFETAITIADRETHGQRVSIDALFIRDHGDGFEVCTLGEIDDERWRGIAASVGKDALPFTERRTFAYGSVYPDDYIDSSDRVTLESALSLMAFLNSPYIPKQTGRLTRPERREIARYKADDVGEEITFVMLRRPEPPAVRRPGDETQVDWKHRWIVSGHYRAQWYPSENAHHVIWIAPHLKGPADAPLIEHAYKVAR